MSKIGAKLILVIFLAMGLEAVAQSVYQYKSREYYSYSESKRQMVKDTRDNVATTLTLDDKKNVIQFKFDGNEEIATFDKLIRKGIVPSSSGVPFLHYVYNGPNNDTIHFYISKQSAKIESYGSMLRLIE